MSKIYSKSGIEIKAKQLLSPLQLACPDNVWHELSCQLSGQGAKKSIAASKLISPKSLVLGLIALGVIGFGIWELSAQAGNKKFYKSAKTAVVTQSIAYTRPPEQNNSPLPKASAPLTVNDSNKPAPNAVTSVSAPVAPQALKATPQITGKVITTEPAKNTLGPPVAVGTKITTAGNLNAKAVTKTSSADSTSTVTQDKTVRDTVSTQVSSHKAVHDSAVDAATIPAAGDSSSSN